MIVNFPKSFWKISEQIGYARSVVNSANLNYKERFDRGEKNSHVDTIGILGELIALDYLTRKNISFKMAKLIDHYPSKNADFIVGKNRIDIKCSKKSKYNTFLVNKEAHHKGINVIDKYWFIYILDETKAEMITINYKDVNSWDSRLMKYTEAYYVDIDELKQTNK